MQNSPTLWRRHIFSYNDDDVLYPVASVTDNMYSWFIVILFFVMNLVIYKNNLLYDAWCLYNDVSFDAAYLQ